LTKHQTEKNNELKIEKLDFNNISSFLSPSSKQKGKLFKENLVNLAIIYLEAFKNRQCFIIISNKRLLDPNIKGSTNLKERREMMLKTLKTHQDEEGKFFIYFQNF
jgi:hypothetical protein